MHFNMTKGLPVLLFFLAFLTLGCTSKWVVDKHTTETLLQWPPPPNKPKIQQVMTIRGFREEGTSLKTIFAGRGEGTISQPVAITTGSDGRFAIADTGCRCVHLYVPAEQRYQRLTTANNEEMLLPVSVAFDNELRLFVSDSSRARIFVFDKQGEYLFSLDTLGGSQLKRPTGLAYNRAGKLMYVVDTLSHKIYAIKEKGDVSFSFGERDRGDGNFNFPTHIFSSPSGQLYVTDAMNFRAQIFDASGRFISTFGHHGDGSGDFAMPKGIAADKDGIIFVVDALFDNIQLFNSKGTFLLTLGGRGSEPGEFILPSGIFIDENDTLYVCDTYNHRIQVFQIFRNNMINDLPSGDNGGRR